MAEVNFLVKKGLTVPKGSAATPAVIFDASDPNTGIYSPGADQVAISTNGVQRLLVGNTGIISTGINGAGSLVNGQSLTLERYAGSDLHSRWRTSNISAGLQLLQTVGPVSGGDDVERSRVIFSGVSGTYLKGFQWFDDSGNTVLGYAPASGRIYLGDSTNNGTLSSYLASGTNIAGGTLTIAGGQGTGTGAGGPIVFSTAAAGSSGSSVNPLTERMRIDSSGRLGLGTSSPTQLAHIFGNSPQVYVQQNGAVAGAAGFRAVAAGGDSPSNASYLQLNAGSIWGQTGGKGLYFGKEDRSATHLFLDTVNARVGVGTASPSYLLDVAGDSRISGTNGLRIEAGGTGTQLYNNSGGTVLDSFTASTSLRFLTQSTERARITSSGQLLVGTSSTSQQLSLLVQGSSGSGTSGVVRTAFTGATPAADAALGSFDFSDSGHTPAARIIARRDGGTWTSGTSQPTRLEFSVTADGSASPTEAMRIKNSRIINIANTPTYADNAAAKAGGLVDGDVYRTATGALMIVYT